MDLHPSTKLIPNTPPRPPNIFRLADRISLCQNVFLQQCRYLAETEIFSAYLTKRLNKNASSHRDCTGAFTCTTLKAHIK